MTKTKSTTFKLLIKGIALVFIDWANIYGWTRTLKSEVSPLKLFKYLKTYDQIKEIHFYYGTDKHPKSIQFLKKVGKIGYTVHTKPVKYIKISRNPTKYQRKCDFDVEITIDTLANVEKHQTFMFITGDGDYAPLYQLLLKKKKKIVVIYSKKHIGREVWKLRDKIYLVKVKKLLVLEKK